VLLAFEFFLWFLILSGEMGALETVSLITGPEVSMGTGLEFLRASGSCIVNIGVTGPECAEPAVAGRRDGWGVVEDLATKDVVHPAPVPDRLPTSFTDVAVELNDLTDICGDFNCAESGCEHMLDGMSSLSRSDRTVEADVVRWCMD
jgi:hypothetical protein